MTHYEKTDNNTNKNNPIPVKTKANKKEKITNAIIALFGFTIPFITTLLFTDSIFDFSYWSFTIATILSLTGALLSLKSRSLLFFVISVSYAPFYILLSQLIKQINGYI